MKWIEVVYFLLFCSFSGATPANMTFETNEFTKKITDLQQSNNTEYNPEIGLNTLEMIRSAGYPAEAHVIMTEDGYLLTLHRIPGSNGSLPVLVQHGLLCTSADWVMLGKGKALAYLLADQGYDVWLGNFRGNTYSRAHISLSPSDPSFWNFSFDEVGIYDLPAMVTFITNMTSQPLHTYIGHSMGTTIFYIMASERPEIAGMVQRMISLAPAVFVSHMKSPLRHLFSFTKEFKEMVRYLFHDEFLSQNDFLKYFIKYICDQNLTEKETCADVIFLICGYDHEQLDYALLPVILNHDPAGASTKTLLHFTQIYNSDKFRKYDYGRDKNLLIYNSPEPPEYDLSRTTLPVALIYGSGDWLVNVMDVKKLYRMLPNVVDMYEVPWPKFNHVDFMWAKDASTLLYARILKLMKKNNLNNITTIE